MNLPLLIEHAGTVTFLLMLVGVGLGALVGRWQLDRGVRRRSQAWLAAQGDAEMVLGPGQRTLVGTLELEGVSSLATHTGGDPPTAAQDPAESMRLRVGEATVSFVGLVEVRAGRVIDVAAGGHETHRLRSGDRVVVKGVLHQGSRAGAYRERSADWLLEPEGARLELGAEARPKVRWPAARLTRACGIAGFAAAMSVFAALVVVSETATQVVVDAEAVNGSLPAESARTYLPLMALGPHHRVDAQMRFGRMLNDAGHIDGASSAVGLAGGCADEMLYRIGRGDPDGALELAASCSLSPGHERTLAHQLFALGRMAAASERFARAGDASPRMLSFVTPPSFSALDAPRAHVLAGRFDLAAQAIEALELPDGACLAAAARALHGGAAPVNGTSVVCDVLAFAHGAEQRDAIRTRAAAHDLHWRHASATEWAWLYLLDQRLSGAPTGVGAHEASEAFGWTAEGSCPVSAAAAPGMERLGYEGLVRTGSARSRHLGTLAARRALFEATAGLHPKPWLDHATEGEVMQPALLDAMAEIAPHPVRVEVVRDAFCVAAGRVDRDGTEHVYALAHAWDHPERSLLIHYLDRAAVGEREESTVALQFRESAREVYGAQWNDRSVTVSVQRRRGFRCGRPARMRARRPDTFSF